MEGGGLGGEEKMTGKETGWRDRDVLAVVAFAEVPEPDVVEVVQAEGTRDGVDEDGVGDGDGEDVGEV